MDALDHPRDDDPSAPAEGGRPPAWHADLPREELVHRLIRRTEDLEYAGHRLDMLGVPNATTTMGGTTTPLTVGGRIVELLDLCGEAGVNLGRLVEVAQQERRRRKGPKVSL